MHIQSKHEVKGFNYLCNQCEFKANYRPTLIQHVESKHEGICYSCDVEGEFGKILKKKECQKCLQKKEQQAQKEKDNSISTEELEKMMVI